MHTTFFSLNTGATSRRHPAISALYFILIASLATGRLCSAVPGPAIPATGVISGRIAVNSKTGNPVPTLTSIGPNPILAGSPSTTLTATGTGFVPGSVVRWNGVALTTAYVSSTSLTATIPVGYLASPISTQITVSNPTPGGGASTGVTISVINPVPTLTSVSPTTIPVGSPNTMITVTGGSFVHASLVRWHGANLTTTYVSPTSLTAMVPSTYLTGGLITQITVYTPSGGTSSAVSISVLNPVPTLTSISPNAILAGSPNTVLTVTGTHFAHASVVKWNGASLVTTYVSATSMTAILPSTYLVSPLLTHITVFTPSPGGGTTTGVTITVYNPVPTLTSVSPNAIPIGSPSTIITATGTLFTHVSVVKWNGVSLPTTFVSATSLHATIPSSYLVTAVATHITVFTTGGGTSAGVPISVVNPLPTLTSLTPNQIPVGSPNTVITVAGTNFIHASVVKWNGVGLPTTYVSATSMTGVVPSAYLVNAVATHITVVTPAPGGGTTAGVAISAVNPVPTLTSISPSTVLAGSPNTTLTVTGTHFVSASVVKWNGLALTTTFGTAGQLTATLPSTLLVAPVTTQITVSSPAPGGGTSAGVSISVVNPVPTLASVVPNSIPMGSGSTVIGVTGTNFSSSSVVKWNGTALPTTYGTSTGLLATVPSADLTTATTAQDTVFTPTPGGGTSGSLPVTVSSSVNPYTGTYAGVLLTNNGPDAPGTTTFAANVAANGIFTAACPEGISSNVIDTFVGTISNAGLVSLTQTANGNGSATFSLVQNATTHVYSATINSTSGDVFALYLLKVPTSSPFAGVWTGTVAVSDGTNATESITITPIGTISGSEVISGPGGRTIVQAGNVDIYGNFVIAYTNNGISSIAIGTLAKSTIYLSGSGHEYVSGNPVSTTSFTFTLH